MKVFNTPYPSTNLDKAEQVGLYLQSNKDSYLNIIKSWAILNITFHIKIVTWIYNMKLHHLQSSK